jgi:hypothetical protein
MGPSPKNTLIETKSVNNSNLFVNGPFTAENPLVFTAWTVFSAASAPLSGAKIWERKLDRQIR